MVHVRRSWGRREEKKEGTPGSQPSMHCHTLAWNSNSTLVSCHLEGTFVRLEDKCYFIDQFSSLTYNFKLFRYMISGLSFVLFFQS